MAQLPSGLNEVVAPDEDLARFLTQRSQFSREIAKPSAFLPSPASRETSVSAWTGATGRALGARQDRSG